MKIEDIKKDDSLSSASGDSTAYYKVVKVNRVTVDVIAENGNKVRAYPHVFERRITYKVKAFE